MDKYFDIKTLYLFLLIFAFFSDSYSQTAEDFFSSGTEKGIFGNYQKAIFDYNKAIELDPCHAKAYGSRGFSKANLEDWRGAILDYNKAIELDPNYAQAYQGRGISKIFIDKKNSGCLDLSKAGELGYYHAYEVIRDLCN